MLLLLPGLLGRLRLLRLRPLLLRLLGPLLRLLRGLWALRLLWLGLLGPLLRLALLLRRARLRLLRLWALLLRGWRRSVLLGFALLAALRVGRGHGPEKQKQRAGGGSSNELHGNHLR